MVLSVIIVNYNVKFFLEQCLCSVTKALRDIDSEILVVDNHSSDGSLEYLESRFPGTRFLANKENTGFARANNQALDKARGKYILFLNPDTILPEDAPATCISFLDSTPEAGGLGLRMVDGSGRFLKESRRGYPSAWVAFCKLSGLAYIFPRSKWFAGYYLGHLPSHITHPAPVLSGACLMVSRRVLAKTGGFDERFFMYAEDIDLSYRFSAAGFVNYYMAATTIVHFKGESTHKDSRYVRLFYKAMSQFRQKHARGALTGLLNPFMELAIWLRASITMGAGFLLRPFRPPEPSPGPTNSTGDQTILLAGDPATARDLVERLVVNGVAREDHIRFTPGILGLDLGELSQLILCEGGSFSFSDCIRALQELTARRPAIRVRFHASGSASIVGSSRRDGQGEITALPVPGPGANK
jgi:GT2 family glycosyltransferase